MTVAAAELKAKGNTLFGKGKFAAAADLYTEALVFIGADNKELRTILLLNRALCFRKLEKWEAVEDGCNTVLRIDAESVKAHYYLGLACHHGNPPRLQAARNHLERALHFAREQGDTIKVCVDCRACHDTAHTYLITQEDIWRELAQVQYTLWEQQSAQRIAAYNSLCARLERLLVEEDASSSERELLHEVFDGALRKVRVLMRCLFHAYLFPNASKTFQDQQSEPPSCFMCPLTMSIYRDPVTCESGMTYERSVLLEHLAKVC